MKKKLKRYILCIHDETRISEMLLLALVKTASIFAVSLFVMTSLQVTSGGF
jgi:hypothetical protein